MPSSGLHDFVIVGGGVAGLRAAIGLAAAGRVLVLTKAEPAESNTGYAQGGMAAAFGDDDSPSLHAADTIRAGDGLCDEEAVRVLRRRRSAPRSRADRVGRALRPRRRRPAGARTRGGAQRAARAARRRRHRPRDRPRAVGARARARRRRRPSITRWSRRSSWKAAPHPASRYFDADGVRHEARARCDAARNRRRGSGVSRNHEPGRSDRRRHRARLSTLARASPISSSCSFIRRRSTATGAPRFLISEALRGEGARLVNQRRRGVHGRATIRMAIWRRATSWRAASSAKRSGPAAASF